MNARVIGWFIVTTGIVTALPLIFEVIIIHNIQRLQADNNNNTNDLSLFRRLRGKLHWKNSKEYR